MGKWKEEKDFLFPLFFPPSPSPPSHRSILSKILKTKLRVRMDDLRNFSPSPLLFLPSSFFFLPLPFPFHATIGTG